MSLPGQVPEGWKRYYFIPWGASILGGLCGGMVSAMVRESSAAEMVRALLGPSGGWRAVAGIVIGAILGMGFTVAMLCKVSEDSARRRWLTWSGTGFTASALTTFLVFVSSRISTVYLP